MTGVTNTELAVAIQQVITRVDAREDELKGWQAGAFDGGPFGDGRYGITNLLGEVGFFKAPARLEYEVGLLTTAGTGAVAAAEAAQSASEAALASAAGQATNASQSASAASTSASQAQTFRNEAANSEANALVHRNAAQTAADATSTDVIAADWARISAELARDDALLARDETLVARGDALVARDEAQGFAASIDPSLLATKAELQTSLNALVDAAPGTLDTLNEIAAALGDDPNFATTVTTSLAGKAPLVHGHVISDVSGLQTALDGKQPIGSYAASAHNHVISDVTGLQTALDGKQAAGSYAASAHNHVISNVTGLQAALDAKLASTSFTWTNLAGKPSTFPPSTHTHSIAQITNLQQTLDGKQPVGNYLTSFTESDPTVPSHVKAITTTNIGNWNAAHSWGNHAAVGYLTGITSGQVTSALGFTPYNSTNPAGYITSSALSPYALLSGANFTGNVGIGTSSPAVKLELAEASACQVRVVETSASVDTRVVSLTSAGLVGTYSNHPLAFVANSSERMRITSAGNVGIGTSNPIGALHVRTGVNQNFPIRGPVNLANGVSLYSVNDANNTLLGIEYTASLHAFLGGSLGLGTTSPQNKLDVVGGVLAREDAPTGANPLILRNANTGDNTGKSTTALFQGTDTVGTVKNIGSLGLHPDDSNYVGSNLRFSVRSGDSLAERMRITSAGNVGIGLTNPSERLHVSGNARVTGSLVVGSVDVGQKLAELEFRLQAGGL